MQLQLLFIQQAEYYGGIIWFYKTYFPEMSHLHQNLKGQTVYFQTGSPCSVFFAGFWHPAHEIWRVSPLTDKCCSGRDWYIRKLNRIEKLYISIKSYTFYLMLGQMSDVTWMIWDIIHDFMKCNSFLCSGNRFFRKSIFYGGSLDYRQLWTFIKAWNTVFTSLWCWLMPAVVF